MSHRFILWIDAVGGYLVCLGDRVRIGQAAASGVEIPLLADLARHQATVRRSGTDYLIEPVRDVRLDNRPLGTPALLQTGSQISLGAGVELGFRQPHPLSSTACLDFVSHHRTQPGTQGVVLLAETCVLGPAESSHVVCRGWSKSIVLHRLQESLYCVVEGSFTVDGVVCHGRAVVPPGASVVGEDFSFSLEALP